MQDVQANKRSSIDSEYCIRCAEVVSPSWIKRSKQAAQARLYLNSDVCSNAKLRVQLGKFQECAQAEYELAISPQRVRCTICSKGTASVVTSVVKHWRCGSKTISLFY